MFSYIIYCYESLTNKLLRHPQLALPLWVLPICCQLLPWEPLHLLGTALHLLFAAPGSLSVVRCCYTCYYPCCCSCRSLSLLFPVPRPLYTSRSRKRCPDRLIPTQSRLICNGINIAAHIANRQSIGTSHLPAQQY